GFTQPVMFGQHIDAWLKSPTEDIPRIAGVLNLNPKTIRNLDLTMDDVFVHRIRSLERSLGKTSAKASA
ncbi:MAG: hypothetical protein ACR2PS_08365, partial [Pseudomonadales bacterium]